MDDLSSMPCCYICHFDIDKNNPDSSNNEIFSHCKHGKYYHVPCITLWAAHNPICPTCRKTIVEPTSRQQMKCINNQFMMLIATILGLVLFYTAVIVGMILIWMSTSGHYGIRQT